ncbi:MAG: aryl-sulfate sulfotransferase [Bacteroidota bacterium]
MFKSKIILVIGILVIISKIIFAQTQTVGVFLNDTNNTFKGYTLFAPKQNMMTYLINNEGRKVHEWTASTYPPGQSVYLLEDGNLLRTCMIPGQLGTGGGEGGRLEEYNWNDSLIWSMNYATTTYMQHHDVKKLPNGNIIMLVVEKKTYAEVIAAGFNPSKFQPEISQNQMMLPDCIIEIHPTPPVGGTVVWEWHVWDHLIQEYDATKSNYGDVSIHPELIDAAGDHKNLPLFWNHMNSIDYNPALDQIALSVRGNSEVWIIDHSTTTAQSSSHSGGAHGKGGDLLYRWGNPITYGAGTATDQKYFQQHDVEWVKPGYPGAGNLTCFNNGVSLNYSSIDEITPPVDINGNYTYVSGSAYGPANFAWSYQASPPSSLYSENISGAERLPNGNTIICDGTHGTFIEVTQAGQQVWKYVNPVVQSGPLMQGDTIPHDISHPLEFMNSVFRVYRYPPSYAAFTGKVLTPGAFVELYPASVGDIHQSELFVFPNPFNDKIHVSNPSGSEYYFLANMMGQEVWRGKDLEQKDFSSLTHDVYFLKINSKNSFKVLKMIKE